MRSFSCDNVCMDKTVLVRLGGSISISSPPRPSPSTIHYWPCVWSDLGSLSGSHDLYLCDTNLLWVMLTKTSQCVIRSNPLQTTVVRVNSSVKQFKRERKTMRSSSVHHEARPPLVVVTSVVITTNQYDKRRAHSHQYHIQHWPYFWFGGLTGRCVCKVIEQRLRLGIWFRVRY